MFSLHVTILYGGNDMLELWSQYWNCKNLRHPHLEETEAQRGQVIQPYFHCSWWIRCFLPGFLQMTQIAASRVGGKPRASVCVCVCLCAPVCSCMAHMDGVGSTKRRGKASHSQICGLCPNVVSAEQTPQILHLGRHHIQT